MTREETIEMLKILKEQALSSCNDTAIIDVKKDSFIFVINMTIKLLEQEPMLDKIRTDIGRALSEEVLDDNRHLISDIGIGLEIALRIIDKYKAESEDD